MEAPPINEDELQLVLNWIDSKTFTKPKKNIARDFADGVLVAQFMKEYFPHWVQLHNYSSSSSSSAKYINWKTLNQKVFKKLNFFIHKSDVQSIICVVPGAIQRVLYLIYCHLKAYQAKKRLKKPSQQQQISLYIENQNNPVIKYAKQLSSQLVQKDEIIQELRDTVLILEQKLKKMQQLNRLKGNKIQGLMKTIQEGF